MTLDGKMYFTREGKGIFSAELVNNEFTNVQLLEPSINNLNFCGHPFVSPDGTYLIFDSRERGGFGKADLYISFRENDHCASPIISVRIRSHNFTSKGSNLTICLI